MAANRKITGESTKFIRPAYRIVFDNCCESSARFPFLLYCSFKCQLSNTDHGLPIVFQRYFLSFQFSFQFENFNEKLLYSRKNINSKLNRRLLLKKFVSPNIGKLMVVCIKFLFINATIQFLYLNVLFGEKKNRFVN